MSRHYKIDRVQKEIGNVNENKELRERDWLLLMDSHSARVPELKPAVLSSNAFENTEPLPNGIPHSSRTHRSLRQAAGTAYLGALDGMHAALRHWPRGVHDRRNR